jgi:hypothetical protein
MTTVFTADYIAYIAMILGVLLYVVALYFKKGTVCYMAATCWIMLAFYLGIVVTPTTMTTVFILVCSLFAVLCVGTVFSFRPPKIKAEKPKPMTSDEYTEYLRAMRYGKRAGYDKSGNKTQGW